MNYCGYDDDDDTLHSMIWFIFLVFVSILFSLNADCKLIPGWILYKSNLLSIQRTIL